MTPDGIAAWQAYYKVRANWQKRKEFKERFPEEKGYNIVCRKKLRP